MTFGHSKLVRQQKCNNNWVSYRPPTAHFCFNAPPRVFHRPLWEPLIYTVQLAISAEKQPRVDRVN